MDKKINLAIFFNNHRGIATLNFLKQKKNIYITNIFIAKKNLNKSIIPILKKKNLNLK